jgi:hypothetical protein
MKLNQTNRFGSNILIDLRNFFFTMFSLQLLFSDIFSILFIQSHVTLDVINYQSRYIIHKKKTMTWFSNTCFNSNKVDNNKSIGFQIQNTIYRLSNTKFTWCIFVRLASESLMLLSWAKKNLTINWANFRCELVCVTGLN